eukprot:SAG22_NODE_17549_length_303_cov_0.529412_1_plen_21_part_10
MEGLLLRISGIHRRGLASLGP